jgi:hypothetical protein
VTLFDEGAVPFTVSTRSQIGKAIVAILQHPDETANKYVYVSSATLAQRDILSLLEKATGESWKTNHATVKDLHSGSLEKLKNNDFAGVFGLLQVVNFGEEGLGDHRKSPGGLWNERLGLTEEDPEEVINSVLKGLP